MFKRHYKTGFFSLAALALCCACSDIEVDTPNGYDPKCVTIPSFQKFQANFGGYKNGKKISFKHSDGYLFSLVVHDQKSVLDISCQLRESMLLESSYPIYSIELTAEASSFYYDEKEQLAHDIIGVRLGQYTFSLQNPLAHKNALIVKNVNGKDTLFYGPDSLYIDTMKINGVTYTEVAMSHGRRYQETYRPNTSDTLVKSNARLFYQTKKGILKIELDDGSYIAINEEDD